MVRLFVSLGIEKIRFTGGEPLLRQGLTELIGEIAEMRPRFCDGNLGGKLDGKLDLALTTNGHLLEKMALSLKEAGLDRITVSMDAVDDTTMTRITRVPGSYDRVLAGIRAARAAGLGPVKVNCVLLRGFNDSQIEAFAEFSRAEDVIVRFIEFMPLEEPSAEGEQPSAEENDRTWSPERVVGMDEIIARLERVRPLRALAPNHASETARRFTFDDGRGEIGIIAPVTHPFCGHCSRIRVTSDGKLRTCLFSQSDHDLAGRMARGASDEELRQWIRGVVEHKEARHHIGEPGFLKPSRSMVHIGG
jgi:cyclic pyranopterin phosphate synthase